MADLIKIGQVAELVGKSAQWLSLLDKWSDEREEEGLPRFIPKSTKIGPKGIRHWSQEETRTIREFITNTHYGELVEYSRRQWGERARA